MTDIATLGALSTSMFAKGIMHLLGGIRGEKGVGHVCSPAPYGITDNEQLDAANESVYFCTISHHWWMTVR